MRNRPFSATIAGYVLTNSASIVAQHLKSTVEQVAFQSAVEDLVTTVEDVGAGPFRSSSRGRVACCSRRVGSGIPC